jgi:hypothetical protein
VTNDSPIMTWAERVEWFRLAADRSDRRVYRALMLTTADALALEAATLAILVRRFGPVEARRIQALAHGAHSGRIDTLAYSVWQSAHTEARNDEQ